MDNLRENFVKIVTSWYVLCPKDCYLKILPYAYVSKDKLGNTIQLQGMFMKKIDFSPIRHLTYNLKTSLPTGVIMLNERFSIDQARQEAWLEAQRIIKDDSK